MFKVDLPEDSSIKYPWYPSHSHAESCPVCHGSGKIDQNDSTASTKPCHGCHGLGWVTVHD